jgi:radical SAM superfamily enzyme YgiQ (UPF0313 family)
MKRVLLVNANTERSPYPVPPLGLCLIASGLDGKYMVEIYDGVFDEGKALSEKVLQFNPDYVGFSIRNIDDTVMDREVFYIGRILSDFIEPLKKISGVPIILGGSGFSIFPKELMEMTGAAYGVIGEGEDIFPALLDHLDKGWDVSGIPNVITAGNPRPQKQPGQVYLDSSALQHSDIDRWIDFSPYTQRGAYSVQTKRGCSHGCIYCTYPFLEGKRFRTRTPSDIADELEEVTGRLGPVMFEFVDSTFNDPKGHAEAICREIIRRKLKVRLRTMGINPVHTSEELFELMMEAGFMQIDATPDSASPRVLRNLDKGFCLGEIEKMAGLIKKYDLPTMWFFLFGGPGEDEDSYRETIDFIDHWVNPDDLVYMNAGLRVYPNTPLYKIAEKEGRIRPGQSVFYPPVYYFSERIDREKMIRLITESCRTRPNCLSAVDTLPPAEMVQEAMTLRQATNLSEPMFRTLMRIRRKWINEGKL